MISVLGPTASGADVAEDNNELAVEIGEVGAEEEGEEPLPLLLLPAGPGELAVTMGEDIFGVDDRVIENEWYSMGIRVGRSVSDGQQLASASDRVSSLEDTHIAGQSGTSTSTSAHYYLHLIVTLTASALLSCSCTSLLPIKSERTPVRAAKMIS